MIPEDFPALHDFLRGYFHQDLAAEYGTPEAAVEQFHSEAEPDQFAEVASEWRRLLQSSAALEEFNRGLQRLGSSWLFLSQEDLAKVTHRFSKLSNMDA
jgi:hypothetical protein